MILEQHGDHFHLTIMPQFEAAVISVGLLVKDTPHPAPGSWVAPCHLCGQAMFVHLNAPTLPKRVCAGCFVYVVGRPVS